ncbi:hypothetical protein GFS60_08073 (plasmid) [Rhodococcus sp. WAY2]|nr:hypothetical protein GFS60_08073 [Rhodococcus sp. WAY2]
MHVHTAHGSTVTPAERTTLEAAGVWRLCLYCDSTVDVYVMFDGVHRTSWSDTDRTADGPGNGYRAAWRATAVDQ